MAKKNSNKQEAKELAQLIDNLKNSSSKIELELNQLRVRRAELEKELKSVKAIIEHNESNLTQIPNAIWKDQDAQEGGGWIGLILNFFAIIKYYG